MGSDIYLYGAAESRRRVPRVMVGAAAHRWLTCCAGPAGCKDWQSRRDNGRDRNATMELRTEVEDIHI
jgi:hypothetical protein